MPSYLITAKKEHSGFPSVVPEIVIVWMIGRRTLDRNREILEAGGAVSVGGYDIRLVEPPSGGEN